MVHFSKNTPTTMKEKVCDILDMKECNHSSMYLGNPFCKFQSINTAFQHIMDKVAAKLARWKGKALSLTRRTILIKSVAAAVPSYVMQTFLLTRSMSAKMDKLICRFWWGFDDHQRHLHMKAWDYICCPKLAVGLGIRKFHEVNTAFITKLCWSLCAELNKTWVQLVRSKYLRGKKILDFNYSRQQASWVWNGMRKCYDSLRRGMCFTIGRKSIVHTYEEPWLPDLPNFCIPRDVSTSDDLTLVRNLMTTDGLS